MSHTSFYPVEFRLCGIVTYMDITMNINLGVTFSVRDCYIYGYNHEHNSWSNFKRMGDSEVPALIKSLIFAFSLMLSCL